MTSAGSRVRLFDRFLPSESTADNLVLFMALINSFAMGSWWLQSHDVSNTWMGTLVHSVYLFVGVVVVYKFFEGRSCKEVEDDDDDEDDRLYYRSKVRRDPFIDWQQPWLTCVPRSEWPPKPVGPYDNGDFVPALDSVPIAPGQPFIDWTYTTQPGSLWPKMVDGTEYMPEESNDSRAWEQILDKTSGGIIEGFSDWWANSLFGRIANYLFGGDDQEDDQEMIPFRQAFYENRRTFPIKKERKPRTKMCLGPSYEAEQRYRPRMAPINRDSKIHLRPEINEIAADRPYGIVCDYGDVDFYHDEGVLEERTDRLNRGERHFGEEEEEEDVNVPLISCLSCLDQAQNVTPTVEYENQPLVAFIENPWKNEPVPASDDMLCSKHTRMSRRIFKSSALFALPNKEPSSSYSYVVAIILGILMALLVSTVL